MAQRTRKRISLLAPPPNLLVTNDLPDERSPLMRSQKISPSRKVSHSSRRSSQIIEPEVFSSGSSARSSFRQVDFEGTSVTDSGTFLMQAGNKHLMDQKFESLDYDTCENTVFLEEQNKKPYFENVKTGVLRWLVILMIGILTACTAAVVDISIEEISSYKFGTMKKYVDSCTKGDCLIIPLLIWLIYNICFALTGALLVIYVAPVAAGSGIPAIKCYLNGVKIPEVVRIKTFFVKAAGVILSLLGGLAVGKEGPMIHCGAVIAAGISQGKSSTFKKDFKIFNQFREDHEKRDFVSAGAAAGVAAAFGAPVGGVLFSLEEGASFWNQSLTWRIFFCSMISTFSLNLILSAYHKHPGQLSYSGLINFGQFEHVTYSFAELGVYILIGAIGGLLGALFNFINSKLTMFRIKYLYQKWKQAIEVVLVSVMTAIVGFLMIYFSSECQDLGKDPIKQPLQLSCGDAEYNVMGAIWLQTPEASVRSLFHDPPGSWSPTSLAIFFVCYFFIACWTYGLSVSSGIFIPTLLVGAAWGRLLGICFVWFFSGPDWVNPGVFALLGAAAMLGGVVRMTLSLTVILIEATGNIQLGLPLMITLMVTKLVGDFFNEGLYDIHIQLSSVPFLAWDPPPFSENVYASEVMSTPVTTLFSVEKVGRIADILQGQPHNGFPVVDDDPRGFTNSFGRMRGLILRWQLIVIIQKKMFNELADDYPNEKLDLSHFRDAYPRYTSIEDLNISREEREFTIDLRPYMNPSVYSVTHAASLPRIFRLFRALGLRHLVVVNDRNLVIGMVTRKDLARYRLFKKGGQTALGEFQVSHG